MAMADLRQIATLCRAYNEAYHHYPAVKDAEPNTFNIASVSELKRVMVDPQAGDLCPTRDPWGAEYRYGVTAEGNVFILVCLGLDGRQTTQAVPDDHVGTHCFEDDIIWLQDRFVQEPQGEQKKCA